MTDEAWLGLGALLVAALVYWAARRNDNALEARTIQRDQELEARVIEREETRRESDAREARIDRVVTSYQNLMLLERAGSNTDTLKRSGVAELRDEAELWEAVRRIRNHGSDPLSDIRVPFDGSFDVLNALRLSLVQQCSVAEAIRELRRAR